MNASIRRPMMPTMGDEASDDVESDESPATDTAQEEASEEDVAHVKDLIGDMSAGERKAAYDLLCKEFDHGAKEYSMQDFES